MSVSTDDMRYMVARAYGSKAMTWRHKVARMSDNQVVALYYSFVERGLIGSHKRNK